MSTCSIISLAISSVISASQNEPKLDGVIADYHRGLVPLVVPLTLVKHYVEMFDVGYVRDQVYLNPHPKELMLRNRV